MTTFYGTPMAQGLDAVPNISADDINNLPSKVNLASGDLILVWNSESGLQKVKVTYGDLLNGLGIVDPTTHIGDNSIHFIVDDSNQSAVNTWSSSKIDGEITALVVSVGGVQALLNLHISDGSIHQVLNDASTLTTEVFSASKVLQLTGDVQANVTTLSNTVASNKGQTDSHEADTGIHSPINDSLNSTGNLWSGQKINQEVNTLTLEGVSQGGRITQNEADILTLQGTVGAHLVLDDVTPSTTEVYSSQKVEDLAGFIDSDISAIDGRVTVLESDTTTHEADGGIHSQLNDTVTGASTLWSSSKVDSEIALAVGAVVPPVNPQVAVNQADILALDADLTALDIDVGVNTNTILLNETAMDIRVDALESGVNPHISDSNIHKRLDDTTVNADELWSSLKISSEIADVVASSSGAALLAHTGDGSIHFEIDDINPGVGSVYSSAKVDSEVALVDAGVTSNGVDITALEGQDVIHTGLISGNAANILSNTNSVAALNGEVSTLQAEQVVQDAGILSNQASLSTLSTVVGNNTSSIVSNDGEILSLQNQQVTQDSSIQVNSDDITLIQSDVAIIQGEQTVQDTLIAGKEDSFSKNTGFNLDLGNVSGTVSEGNHTHESQIEVLDLNPLLVAEGTGMTNYANVDGENGWATLLYRDTSGRVSLHAMIRNTSGVVIPASSNLLLCTIPAGWRPRIHQSGWTSAYSDSYSIWRLSIQTRVDGVFRISSTFGNTININAWYHVQMNWVV
jgi:hypothetical protein